MISEEEALRLIVRALELFKAEQRPVPSYVSQVQAADMLGVSVSTVKRMKLKRNRLGQIPYSVVVEVLSASSK